MVKFEKLFQNISRKISKYFEKYFVHFREVPLFQKIQKVLPESIMFANLKKFQSNDKKILLKFVNSKNF